MVRPILEYVSSAWDPYTNVNICIQKLESVQKRAAIGFAYRRLLPILLNQCSKYATVVRLPHSSVQEKIS